jgi:hypothetical protein
MARKNWTEIQNVEAVLPLAKELGEVRVLAEVQVAGETLPIHGLCFGSSDKSAPTLGLFAGVHGLERVGTHVLLNYLGPLLRQMKWDRDLRKSFERFRLVAIPIVNPGGMLMSSRSNPRGVDIMRNAPVEAQGELKPFVSGHRYSPKWPWYRGQVGEPMEVETQALVQFVRDEVLPSRFAITVDIHSGFGLRDRLWYPYSRTREAFPNQKEVDRLAAVLEEALPFHVYKIEPQSSSYMIHGDPWDLLYDEHRESHGKQGSVFLPWCLEMGSWTWLKKNPRQIFTRGGIYNPILPHRYGRIMRRHKPLLDFLKSAATNHESWRAAIESNAGQALASR